MDDEVGRVGVRRGGMERALDRSLHVVGGDLLAVVEADALAEDEAERRAVLRGRPALGEVGDDLPLDVVVDEAREHATRGSAATRPSPMLAGSSVRMSPKLADVSIPPRRGVARVRVRAGDGGGQLVRAAGRTRARARRRATRTRARSLLARIERIAQALPEQVEAEDARHDGEPGRRARSTAPP